MTEPKEDDPREDTQEEDRTQADLDADWGAALEEQFAATGTSPSEEAEAEAAATEPDKDVRAAPELFQPLTAGGDAVSHDLEMIKDIPVQLSVELGRTRLTIKSLLQLGQGSIVELDGLAGEPMDIYVNGYLIAQGEVVVVDERYGIRITDIITPSDRINRLNNRR